MDAIFGPTPHRAVEVTGADRLSYLEAVLSQRVEGLQPGDATAALHLDVHGSPLGVFDVAALDDRLVLVVPEAVAAETVEVLGGRTFLADARFALLDAEVRWLRGRDAEAVAAAAGLAVTTGRTAEHGDVVAVGTAHGIALVGDVGSLKELADRLEQEGAEPADADRMAAWEIVHGVPRWGEEIVPGQLPEELGLLPTHVHLAKGCYPGQEAVARMWQLGRPRRRLAVVAADPGVEPGWEAGSGRARARVTRAAEDDGRRLALAFVPGDAAVGDRFEGEDGAGVTVESLVGADRPVPGHDPAMTRRRDRR